MNKKETEKGVTGLESAAGFIQTKLSKKLRLRVFPRLTFIHDTSLKDGFEMVQKLNETLTIDLFNSISSLPDSI